MAKTAAQIVPLKTQLASSLTMLRFADTSEVNTTSTFWSTYNLPGSSASGAVFEERTYDTSGSVTNPLAPSVGALLTGLSGAPTLAAPTVAPTGGQITTPYTQYLIVPMDSSSRAYRPTWYVATFPNSGSTNQAVLSVNWTGMTNVYRWYVFKTVFYPSGASNSYGWNATASGMTGTTFTITDSYPHSYSQTPTFSTGSWNSYSAYSYYTPNPASTITGTFTVAGNTNSTGGYGTGNLLPVSMCAYNRVGATQNTTTQWMTIPYADAIASGPTVTATPSISTGSLAAGTYYYQVSASNNQGESLPGAEVSATLSATGEVILSWSAVTGASTYYVYRASASGAETLLGSTNALTYTDTGAATPSAVPPNANQSGCGSIATYSLNLSWSAVTGATGYRIFTGFGSQYYTDHYYALPVVTGTSYTATGSETLSPNMSAQSINNSGSKIVRVAKAFQVNGASTPTKIGLSFAPVANKQYRAFVTYSNSTWTSPWITAQNSAMQYMEFTMGTSAPNMSDGATYYFGIEGQDTSSTIGLPMAVGAPTTLDVYGSWGSDNGTYVATGSTGGYQVSQSPWTDASAYLVPIMQSTQIPMKIVRRLQNTATQITPQGTLSGLSSKSPEIMWSTNYTYANLVKSIVPSWAAAAGSTNAMSVEVSPDGGSTWYSLVNNARFVFPTPTKQLMYRLTIGGNTQVFTILPGMNGLDSAGSYINSANNEYTGYYFTADTGQPIYYYNGRGSNNPQDMMASNGTGVQFGAYSSNRSSFAILQTPTADSDVSAVIDSTANVASSYGAVFCRSTSGYSNYGYYLSLGANGTLSLYIMNNQSLSSFPTALSSIATGLNPGVHRIRLVAAGAHLMGFVDGQLYIDVNDTTFATGQFFSGVSGYQTIASLLTIQGAAAGAPVNQMESFTAYLEY